jgi:RimJ/RimL family protein N-acetyltransferase
MMGIEVRQLEGADAEAFSALRRLVTADNPVPMGLTLEEELNRPLQGFRDQLSAPAPNAAFGVFVDGQLRACAALAWTSRFPSSMHKALLWGCFVEPGFRGRGLGRQVVGRALEHARQNSIRRVNLTVFLPNHAAVTLYASLGFQPYGLEPEAVCLDGNFHDGQHMTLVLAD